MSIERPRIAIDPEIVARMYGKTSFFDLYERNPSGAVSVVIPAAHVNRFWEENLKSIYREIPVGELIIGDAGLPPEAIKVVRGFPRVRILDHASMTLGFSLRQLIMAVQCEWFCYLHSDVYLPPDWFVNMVAYQGEGDWIGCRMIQTTIWVHEVDYGDRPYTGAQMGRKAAFLPGVEAIEDDYVWRQEEFVLAKLVRDGGGKVIPADTVFHYHQQVAKESQVWNPKVKLEIRTELSDSDHRRLAEMQYFGLLKYAAPTSRWEQEEASTFFVELWVRHGYRPTFLWRRAVESGRGWPKSLYRGVPKVLLLKFLAKSRKLLF